MKKAIFLFDTTGYAAKPFTEKGWHTTIIDILNIGQYAENPYASEVLAWDILAQEEAIIKLCLEAEFVFGFPPCTDLAVSGARHFAAKAKKNPAFQLEAVHLARSVERIGEAAGILWALENPVSRLSTLWRKPNFTFHPWHYSRWLPEDDKHPDYPRYIMPQDCYPKKTNLWTSAGWKMPPKKPLLPKPGFSKQTTLLGGKSAKTKRIRSASPRAFFTALAETWGQ